MIQEASETTNQRFDFTQSRDNNAMHAKPDLRVVLKWKIARSGSVIADVILLSSTHAQTSLLNRNPLGDNHADRSGDGGVRLAESSGSSYTRPR